ncbi:hypothetical protein AVEN_27317-1 [Araneus ventricosus]|uniref:Uncharacterized protein n=1 Tax=Araneus ventricosus TaxID=182803 RepID=A0A4Y2MWK8_ARAVE|nr:hypothetical protein AVEN_27317-1 [Araneus ventricosus]
MIFLAIDGARDLLRTRQSSALFFPDKTSLHAQSSAAHCSQPTSSYLSHLYPLSNNFQASSPDSQKTSSQNMLQMSCFPQNNHQPPFKKHRNLSYKSSDDQWYMKSEPPPSPPPDGQEVFGRYVASKLREMDKASQMLSERLIAEVLFRGQMGLLSRNTCLSDDEQQPPTVKVED